MNAEPSNCNEPMDVHETDFVDIKGALPPVAGSARFIVVEYHPSRGVRQRGRKKGYTWKGAISIIERFKETSWLWHFTQPIGTTPRDWAKAVTDPQNDQTEARP